MTAISIVHHAGRNKLLCAAGAARVRVAWVTVEQSAVRGKALSLAGASPTASMQREVAA